MPRPAMCALERSTQRASQSMREHDEALARLARVRAHAASLAHELQAVEQVMLDGDLLSAMLVGRRFVYVGGRPGSNAVLRAWSSTSGGEFVHHVARIDDDGGPRAQQFAALLQRADAVLCPLDTIDPDSLAALRAHCARRRVRWIALRTSSVASFIAGVLKAQRISRAARAAACVCPRHG
ncbi:DUF2325 domain-containing protein [Burkholderia vietnamiensis]|uniref:DUF2325 domain-containing protein n=1 Tax=Burkholderia vietnamiensis TaxID=60552 RepID=UPI00075D264C|nr:DUF2325 domain-containing protein [Burkholderia vietnamiensis]KVG11468.1 hypothetical protein WJ24_08685 [Burkholderia vietnamiensis]MBR7918554.1 DUF2325 domain-containing protein [Burkholderia vietnamiensis]MBR7976205.1 DUF2325 domain-containing protein [Burkholderia vietnamiensis]